MKTNLEEVVEFCAAQGFDALDPTGYYFPGYPEVPSDEYIYNLKRKAHQLGVAISGTGVRNDFTQPDQITRTKEIEFIKRWIEVTAKLSAPVIRIFAGTSLAISDRAYVPDVATVPVLLVVAVYLLRQLFHLKR